MAKLVDYFKVVAPKPGVTAMTDSQRIGDQGVYANYTWYQRLIQGSASRLARYTEYDLMDNDVEISRSLDTIAEEMIGQNPNAESALVLNIHKNKEEHIKSSVVVTLNAALQYWEDIHDWRVRLFDVARVMVKYGDCFFIRQSETSKWQYVHPKNVVAAIVDEHDMTKIVGWQIKRNMLAPNSPYNMPAGTYGGKSTTDLVETFPADRVIRFTLNNDMSESAPFGDSIMRAVYRAQKQKELLEDAILIYRIQRAPEKRVFKIDVGKMPPHRVKAYLEQFKNEIRQRKIPSMGGGTDQIDSVYNPQQMMEDFFFAKRSDGGGSTVETLAGGQGLGQLDDLDYFQWKVFRGLRIPLSYMREGNENAIASDGKTGIAYIQELRFAMYIKRLQQHINSVLDSEFKRYLKLAGISVDDLIFDVSLPEPENFGIYRQQQLDSDLLSTFSQTTSTPQLSKRFSMKKYLQLTDEELIINEKQLMEEMGVDENDPDALSKIYGTPAEVGALGDMGSGMMAGGMGGGDTGWGLDQGAMGPTGVDNEQQTGAEPVPAA
jgi:hypothetical protein